MEPLEIYLEAPSPSQWGLTLVFFGIEGLSAVLHWFSFPGKLEATLIHKEYILKRINKSPSWEGDINNKIDGKWESTQLSTRSTTK